MLKSPLPKRSCSRGFTLLEVVIAMSILVVGISAMAALSAASMGGDAISFNKTDVAKGEAENRAIPPRCLPKA